MPATRATRPAEHGSDTPTPAEPELTALRLRTAMPARVLAYRVPAAYQAGLRQALDGKVGLEFTAAWHICRQQLLARKDLGLLVVIPSEEQAEELTQLVELRQRFPHVPTVGLFVEGVSDLSATALLGVYGVRQVINSSRLDKARAVLKALSTSEIDAVANQLLESAPIDVHPECFEVLRAAMRLAHQPVTLSQLARAFGMHERTLRKHCENHGMPSPQQMIGWARCFMIAHYLEEKGRPVQSIADLLGFPSPALMTNHIRRYTRQTPSDLREYGAVRTVSRFFQAQIIKPVADAVPRAAAVGEAREPRDPAARPKLRLI